LIQLWKLPALEQEFYKLETWQIKWVLTAQKPEDLSGISEFIDNYESYLLDDSNVSTHVNTSFPLKKNLCENVYEIIAKICLNQEFIQFQN